MSKGYPLQTIEDQEAEIDALKRLLWLRHGCPVSSLYGDDGEMQCGQCGIDFKRSTAGQIEGSFIRINYPKMAELLTMLTGTAKALDPDPEIIQRKRPTVAELNTILNGPEKPIITKEDGSIGVEE
jgi:hypothetical protein